MIMKRFTTGRTVLLGIGLVIALALAACGGDSDSDNADGAPSRGGAFTSGEFEAGGDGDDFASAPSDGVTVAGSTSGGGAALQSTINQKLIRTAMLDIETDGVTQAFGRIGDIAVLSGGLVFSSRFGNDGDDQTASITIRVPNARYEDVLTQLRDLGEVRREDSNASDVTEEFTDLESSLANLQATEQRYLELLARAQTIEEILIVQDRVNGTRAQIDQIQGRLNLLGNQTDLATITANLVPLGAPPADEGGLGSPLEVMEEAFDASLAVLLGILIVVIAIGAFGWWLLPLAAIGVYFGRRQQKQDRARNQAPPPAPAP
jgi:hypothetical protein